MRVRRSLPCSWKRFCELEHGSDCLWCSDQPPHVLNKLEQSLTWAMNGWKILEQPRRKVLTFWGGDWWRTCYSLKTKVRTAYKCISEAVWMIWSRNTWGKLGFECKNKKLAGLVFVFAVSDSWNFQQGFKAFLQCLLNPLNSYKWV